MTGLFPAVANKGNIDDVDYSCRLFTLLETRNSYAKDTNNPLSVQTRDAQSPIETNGGLEVERILVNRKRSQKLQYRL
jgi:hypothetical protein